MNQKIEWYREVLDLEPGSRVFFPLAKLLAEDDQIHDAIITLRQGVLRHPDHVEARLFLVELLSRHETSGDISNEVERLGALFAKYPGFWSAWSMELGKNPAMQDAALAIKFFSAALQGKTVTWASIIEYGLRSLLAVPGELPVVAEHAVPSVPEGAVESFDRGTAFDGQEPRDEPAEEPYQAEADEDVLEEEDFSQADESNDDYEDDDINEEAFSLRTRSMAEVLAEQGDISGALEIYNELIANAPGEEKASLESRAEELSRRLSASGPVKSEGPGAVENQEKDGNRIIGIFEALAERLEARSR